MDIKFKTILTPEKFLIIAGTFSVVIGILGVFLLGPTPEKSIFGHYLWMDGSENLFHTSLGLIGLAVVLIPGLNSTLRPYLRQIVFLAAVIALFFGFYGFFVTDTGVPNTFGITNLEHP